MPEPRTTVCPRTGQGSEKVNGTGIRVLVFAHPTNRINLKSHDHSYWGTRSTFRRRSDPHISSGGIIMMNKGINYITEEPRSRSRTLACTRCAPSNLFMNHHVAD